MDESVHQMNTGRLLGIDLARAVAIIGMVIINFNVAMKAQTNGPDGLVWLMGLGQGRAAVMFVLLAGIGMSLMGRRARLSGDPAARSEVRRILLGRALFLFVIGLLFQTVWPGDILHYYGLYLALGSCLLFAPVRLLLALIAGLIFGFILMFLALDYDLGWNWSTLLYEGFWTPAGFVRNLLFNGFHSIFPWFGFLLTGLCLGRLDLRNPEVFKRLILWGAVIGFGAEGVSALLIHYLGDGEIVTSLCGRECLPPNLLFVLQTLGVGTFVIGLCLELGIRFRESRVLHPFMVLGQTALSIYIGHVILGLGCMVLLGMMDGSSTLVISTLAALVTCVMAFVMTLFWWKRFPRGPLEIVMRRVADGPGGVPSRQRLVRGTLVVALVLSGVLAVGWRMETTAPLPSESVFEHMCEGWGLSYFESEREYLEWLKQHWGDESNFDAWFEERYFELDGLWPMEQEAFNAWITEQLDAFLLAESIEAR